MLYKDTDTRVTRGGRTRRSSKNSICFFYPPLPFHLSSSSNHTTAPFPSLLSSHRAGSTEARPERQSSSLHPRPAFASSPACECEQEPLRSAWARVSLQRECDRRLPSSSFLEQCGSGASARQAKQSGFQGTDRTTKPQPQHFLSLCFPRFLACLIRRAAQHHKASAFRLVRTR